VLRRAKFRCNQVTKKEKILKTENRGAISGDISIFIESRGALLCFHLILPKINGKKERRSGDISTWYGVQIPLRPLWTNPIP